jgi:hypothetical protein
MSSNIDFAVATGFFLIFFAFLIVYLLNYLNTYFNLSSISDQRTVAFSLFNTLFGSKGVPKDWESRTYTPVKIGLATDLYKAPLTITETNGTARTNYTINVSMTFDSGCRNKTWNTTVRIYDENNTEIPNQLFNQVICKSNFIKSADIVFNLTIDASASKNYFVYYSPQKSTVPSAYTFAFPNPLNYTAVVGPEEKMTAVSVDKMIALRNLSYDQIGRVLSQDYQFYVEVSK